MVEYYTMKADLEPQGYIITNGQLDKIFINHEVTINYHDKKSKKQIFELEFMGYVLWVNLLTYSS